MSILLTEIRAQQLAARKVRDVVKTNLLTTLISDASMIGKNDGNRKSTDRDVLKTIKSYIVCGEETLKVLSGLLPCAKVIEELAILNSLLPQQLSSDSLVEAIDQIITSINATTIKDMGKVMKLLQDKYDGRYSGTAASSIVKQKLGA